MSKEVTEMLKSIQKDGLRYMPARGVIVQYINGGFNIWVDKEEYSWDSTIKGTVIDIVDLQDSRPL